MASSKSYPQGFLGSQTGLTFAYTDAIHGPTSTLISPDKHHQVKVLKTNRIEMFDPPNLAISIMKFHESPLRNFHCKKCLLLAYYSGQSNNFLVFFGFGLILSTVKGQPKISPHVGFVSALPSRLTNEDSHSFIEKTHALSDLPLVLCKILIYVRVQTRLLSRLWANFQIYFLAAKILKGNFYPILKITKFLCFPTYPPLSKTARYPMAFPTLPPLCNNFSLFHPSAANVSSSPRSTAFYIYSIVRPSSF